MKPTITKEELDSVFGRLISAAHGNSKEKGFWGTQDGLDLADAIINPRDDIDESAGVHIILSKLMLVVTEVGEAAEDARVGRQAMGLSIDSKTGKPEGFLAELADVMIRVWDLASVIEKMTGQTLTWAIMTKMEYNHGRSAMHGKKA